MEYMQMAFGLALLMIPPLLVIVGVLMFAIFIYRKESMRKKMLAIVLIAAGIGGLWLYGEYHTRALIKHRVGSPEKCAESGGIWDASQAECKFGSTK